MNSLGERIAYYRKKQNLTQEQLAEKCAVTPQAVSKWENDLTAPDIMLLPVLSAIFHVSCDEILGVRRAEVEQVEADLIDLNKMLLRVKMNRQGGDVININLPLGLAEVVIKAGAVQGGNAGDILSKIDFMQVISLVKLGAVGKLVEMKSASGDNIEVWVE